MNELPEVFAVRAPWPDELDRLRALLPIDRLRRAAWLWTLATGRPERLVGGAALEPQHESKGQTQLHLYLRPPYRQGPAGAALLAAAVDQARKLDAAPVISDFADDQAPHELLEQFGFSLVRREQVWRVHSETLLHRIRGLNRALTKRVQKLGDVWQGPPQPEHVVAIAEILQAHGLRQEGALIFRDELPSKGTGAPSSSPPTRDDGSPLPPNGTEELFDRELSNVVTVNGRVVAVELTRDIGPEHCFTQYRAVAREFKAHSATINPILMERPLSAFLAHGKRYALITAQGGKQDETIHMARKSQGQLVRTTRLYRRV